MGSILKPNLLFQLLTERGMEITPIIDRGRNHKIQFVLIDQKNAMSS